MNPQQSSKVAWCGAFVLMGAFVATLAGFSSGSIEKAGATPIENRRAASLANAELADALQAPPTRASNAVVVSVTAVAADTTATSIVPKPFVVASADPSQKFSAEIPLVQAVTPSTPDPVPDEMPDEIKAPVSSIEAPDDCLIADICINQYLWALYERTPKQDTNKVHERRKVTVRKKGKKVTVTKRFTRLVDADFTWKDPNAAGKAGMPMMDYVIGGMDRGFKRKLLYMLLAAEEAGLSPGITSAFRDDYRQSIATGQKAASDRSYHGGSLRGGYGYGLAADVVSVKGAGGTRSQRWVHSDRLWKWIDEHGKEFGIGRPYLDRDAPHVAPIDGREYATHYRAPKIQQAKADQKKPSLPAEQDDKRAQDDKSKTRTASIQLDGVNARRDQ